MSRVYQAVTCYNRGTQWQAVAGHLGALTDRAPAPSYRIKRSTDFETVRVRASMGSGCR